jgi:hypothetical protein
MVINSFTRLPQHCCAEHNNPAPPIVSLQSSGQRLLALIDYGVVHNFAYKQKRYRVVSYNL